MKIVLRQSMLVLLLVVSLGGTCFGEDNESEGFEIYFFGQNLKSFQNSNWFEVAVGATASLITHELGHVLALEFAGKSWDFEASLPFGFAVHTDEFLDDSEYLNIGRSGFALQILIGFGLTSFETTRSLNFTKGWVSMNSLQISSYRSRPHTVDDDFAMIDKGGGNSDLEFSVLSVLSLNNQLRLESNPWTLMTESFFTPHSELNSFRQPVDSTADILASETDIDLSETFPSKVGLPRSNPQDVFDEISLDWTDNWSGIGKLSN